jgi:hypothetical protein
MNIHDNHGHNYPVNLYASDPPQPRVVERVVQAPSHENQSRPSAYRWHHCCHGYYVAWLERHAHASSKDQNNDIKPPTEQGDDNKEGATPKPTPRWLGKTQEGA